MAAAVLGDGHGLRAERRRDRGRLRRRLRPPLECSQPDSALGSPRPPLRRQRPGLPRTAAGWRARRGPGHSPVGRENGPPARRPDRPHRPHPRPGLASRRPPTLLGRLGHHRPRLGRGEGRADHPSQQPYRPGPRAGPERRRLVAGLRRLGLHHPLLEHESEPRGACHGTAGPRDPRLAFAPTADGWRRAGTNTLSTFGTRKGRGKRTRRPTR